MTLVPGDERCVDVVLALLAQRDLRRRLLRRRLDRRVRREEERLLVVGEHDERVIPTDGAPAWIDGRHEIDGRLRLLQQPGERLSAGCELLELVELVANVQFGAVALGLNRLAGVVDALAVVTEERLDLVGRLLWRDS